MKYEDERAKKIEIISIIQCWSEEEGVETSANNEANLAERIFNKFFSSPNA
jgi:hypothetical protein